jgi:hypothetical protein
MPKGQEDRTGYSNRTEGFHLGEEGIELTAEDERILDRVWDTIREEDETRLRQYAPLMGSLVRWLKVLDAEAIPLTCGNPVGLWWYARHSRRDEIKPKNCRNEEQWSRRMRKLMSEENITAECEEPYPQPPTRRCDLVIQWPALGRVWLEVKGSLRHNDSNGEHKNGNFQKHLLAAGDDLRKVRSLSPATADHIGLLFVGFDTEREQITDEHLELIRSNTGRGDWIEQHARWDDPNRPGGRILVVLWMTASEIPTDMFDSPAAS